MTELLVDDTVTQKPLPSTNIERDRARAHAQYEDGRIGFRKLRSWLKELDHSAGVQGTIDESLVDAPGAITDQPITRERRAKKTTRPRRERPLVGKFARSL